MKKKDPLESINSEQFLALRALLERVSLLKLTVSITEIGYVLKTQESPPFTVGNIHHISEAPLFLDGYEAALKAQEPPNPGPLFEGG